MVSRPILAANRHARKGYSRPLLVSTRWEFFQEGWWSKEDEDRCGQLTRYHAPFHLNVHVFPLLLRVQQCKHFFSIDRLFKHCLSSLPLWSSLMHQPLKSNWETNQNLFYNGHNIRLYHIKRSLQKRSWFWHYSGLRGRPGLLFFKNSSTVDGLLSSKRCTFWGFWCKSWGSGLVRAWNSEKGPRTEMG